MKFLSREKVPNELPDLAIESSEETSMNQKPLGVPSENTREINKIPESIPSPESPKSIFTSQSSIPEIPRQEIPRPETPRQEIRGETYLECAHPEEDEDEQEGNISQKNFFDQVLEDINGEIKDLENLEDWYKNKFLPQDVVSNMRGYWEGNKADIIIQNFGNEYRKKINKKIQELQELEEDWREIYFKLIKKEEKMKEEERELKGLLSEFVNLCRRGKEDTVSNNEKEKEEKTI